MNSPFTKFVGETSFRKKGNESRIPGTKMSYQNVQLLVSSGIPSLDSHIGGGVAVGTLLLVEEDLYNTYSKVLVKYFVAEGITSTHSVLLASGDVSPENLLKDIPTIVEPKKFLPTALDDDLKIAWRYKDQRTTGDISPAFGHSFDLSKPMSSKMIENAKIVTFNPLSSASLESNCKFIDEPYLSLLKRIKATIDSEHLQSSEKHCNKILRIAVSSIASPLWSMEDKNDEQGYALLRFLYLLRSLLRSAFAVSIITVPAIVHQNTKLRDKIRQMSDYVVQLESFIGSEKSKNLLVKDFDGLIQLVKLPVLNRFTYQVPSSDLAFKLRKKVFQIERMHLPPDVQDPSPSEQVTSMCGAPSKLFDF